MSREQEGPPESDLTTEEEGLVGAYAEQPLRDLARPKKGSGVEITDKEKTVLDKVAEKYGEAAIAKHRAEQERGSKRKLVHRVRELATAWREKGLQEDARIASDLEQRINVYAELLKVKRGELEKAGRGKLAAQELSHMFGKLPITYRIGEKGGALYDGQGVSAERLFLSTAKFNDAEVDLLKVQKRIADATQRGREFINSSLSERGELEFYRSFGVLQTDQTLKDLPALRDVPPDEKFTTTLPTNIEGVEIFILKHGQEQGIFFQFSPKFIEKLSSEP